MVVARIRARGTAPALAVRHPWRACCLAALAAATSCGVPIKLQLSSTDTEAVKAWRQQITDEVNAHDRRLEALERKEGTDHAADPSSGQ